MIPHRGIQQAPESEDGAEAAGESSVITLTNANFEAVVESSTADVMVEFYAPW